MPRTLVPQRDATTATRWWHRICFLFEQMSKRETVKEIKKEIILQRSDLGSLLAAPRQAPEELLLASSIDAVAAPVDCF